MIHKPACFLFAWALSACLSNTWAQDPAPWSQITEPYPWLNGGQFTGKPIPESPDPLSAYRWDHTAASDGLQIFPVTPVNIDPQPEKSFLRANTLTGRHPDVEVRGTGSIRIDFGIEMGAWIEMESPDCPGGIEMSIGECDEPGDGKTAVPVQYGHTWRLELNPELYDGVRFAWVHVRSFTKPWHIHGIRAVCQVKPTNYYGSFSCSDPVLTRAWYMSAWGVKAALCKDYFGAILMERGDRMSWTGDAHTSQAAALAAFGNDDFIRKNLENTSTQDNGIRSYSLYWVLSLLDYFHYTGDTATLTGYIGNVTGKLDKAILAYGKDPGLGFYGWDDRLGAGFEIWFRPSVETQNAYRMLTVRVCKEFSEAMGRIGRKDLEERYGSFARATMDEIRKNPEFIGTLGIHAAADAINTGLLNPDEQRFLTDKWCGDRVNRLSLSPFNEYFILQSMARTGDFDRAITSIRDMWGGMLEYGGTTPFETYRPSWNEVIGRNDPVPNTQSGITSLCHPWGAGIVKWLNEEVAGIKPDEPGFRTWKILPHPGRTLKQVSGKTPTPFGELSASFDLGSGSCTVQVPAGTSGTIGIPKAERRIASIRINGRKTWEGHSAYAKGFADISEDPDFIYFKGVIPGHYHFDVRYEGQAPAPVEERITYAARFIGHDSVTGGDWGGRYGQLGHILCNYEGNGTDRKTLPSFVASIDYFRAFPTSGLPDTVVWTAETGDWRALAPDRLNSYPRRAGGYTNSDQTMTVTLGMDRPGEYQVALYFIDWENKNIRMAIEMLDAETLDLVAPVQVVKDFSKGVYLVFAYNRPVKFRIDRIRGGPISLSGIFIDPVRK